MADVASVVVTTEALPRCPIDFVILGDNRCRVAILIAVAAILEFESSFLGSGLNLYVLR